MAHSASEQILGWSYKHNGDWDKIYADVSSKQPFDFSVTPLADIKSKLYGKYITLLDSDYPDYIRSRVTKAPWCIFYRGDVGLLNENNAIGIVAHRILISQAINKYSTYALVQAIKRYAPKNHIYLQISSHQSKHILLFAFFLDLNDIINKINVKHIHLLSFLSKLTVFYLLLLKHAWHSLVQFQLLYINELHQK